MEKETVYTNIFIPDEGLPVTAQEKRNKEGTYWVVQFGDVTLFADRNWLAYLAYQIATVLPKERHNKIVEIINALNKDNEVDLDKIRKEIINA